MFVADDQKDIKFGKCQNRNGIISNYCFTTKYLEFDYNDVIEHLREFEPDVFAIFIKTPNDNNIYDFSPVGELLNQKTKFQVATTCFKKQNDGVYHTIVLINCDTVLTVLEKEACITKPAFRTAANGFDVFVATIVLSKGNSSADVKIGFIAESLNETSLERLQSWALTLDNKYQELIINEFADTDILICSTPNVIMLHYNTNEGKKTAHIDLKYHNYYDLIVCIMWVAILIPLLIYLYKYYPYKY